MNVESNLTQSIRTFESNRFRKLLAILCPTFNVSDSNKQTFQTKTLGTPGSSQIWLVLSLKHVANCQKTVLQQYLASSYLPWKSPHTFSTGRFIQSKFWKKRSFELVLADKLPQLIWKETVGLVNSYDSHFLLVSIETLLFPLVTPNPCILFSDISKKEAFSSCQKNVYL